MLKEPQEYESVFQELKADLQNSEEKNVLVFVSTAECDSVCAVRILQVCAQHIKAPLNNASVPQGRACQLGDSNIVHPESISGAFA